MKIGTSIRKAWLVWLGSLVAVVTMAAFTETILNIPNVFNPNETGFQNQTHFLVFEGSDTAGESPATSNAYYDAIDPRTPANHFQGSKREFTKWLKNAGFISDEGQWNSSGPQLVACNLPVGCDKPAGTYGYGIINTDAHVIVLNAADLGFVRNQFIRCDPSCTAPNPKVYTYLENYPVNEFADSHNGGSGFPFKTGYPTQAEATAAIASALKRPSPSDPPPAVCKGGDTPIGCQAFRIADVAFEWAPPPTNPASSTRYGQLYAYLFDSKTNTEDIAVQPNSVLFNFGPQFTPNLATGAFNSINGHPAPIAVGDPFPPNLDFIGFKEHPGNCFVCHGGKPQNLVNGVYPQQGSISGFRFLPVDVRNLLFTSDNGAESTSRIMQEAHMRAYNKDVLLTVDQTPERDDEGTLRPPHLAEVIKGWYAGFAGDQNMTGQIQNHLSQTTFKRDFVPSGWIDQANGGPAPNGSEKFYDEVFAPACRSCHFNRELSVDFGTAANFKAHGADILNYVLLPLCLQPVDAGFRPMPLAHLTYQRFWQANNAVGEKLLSGDGGPLTMSNTADRLARYLNYAGTADYCNSIH